MTYKPNNQKRSDFRGNIRFVEPKPNKNYVAYDVVHVPKKGWKATPYSLNPETQEYVSDPAGATMGASRGAAVENLFTKHFNMPSDGEGGNPVEHRKMTCIDHLVKTNA